MGFSLPKITLPKITLPPVIVQLTKEAQRLLQIQNMGFVFNQGGRVATAQGGYLKTYLDNNGVINKGYAAQVVSILSSDPWIALATKLAPSNLVVRQWALIDLYKGEPSNRAKIQDMVSLVSQGGLLWAEGYSYWQYTREVLDVWVAKYKNVTDLSTIINMISQVDQNFILTSYKRGATWYPALFGDLYDAPLSSKLQINHAIQTKTVANVALVASGNGSRVTYNVVGKPIGLNVHIPVNNYSVTVTNGVPVGYKFYTGFANKYPNVIAETADVLNPKRIASLG